MKYFQRFFILFVLTILYFSFPKLSIASTLSLSPGSGSIGQGATLPVQVRVNTGGEAINAVSAYLSYPADKLDVAYINQGGAFGTVAEKVGGGGTIKISLATLNPGTGEIKPVTGTVTVATIGFRAKTNVGSATVAFIGGSAAPRASDSSDSLNLGGSSGATFNLVQKSAAPSASPANETKLEISNVEVSELTRSSATIKWKTNLNSNSFVEFGLENGNYILNQSDNAQVTDHTIKLENPLFIPGLVVNFRVKSKGTGTEEVLSENMVFQLKGNEVKIKLVDSNKNPSQNTKVMLYSSPMEGTTDANGEVNFKDVTEGKHLIVAKLQNSDITREIMVDDSESVQTYELQVDASSKVPSLPPIKYLLAGIGVIALIAIAAGIIFYYKKRRAQVLG